MQEEKILPALEQVRFVVMSDIDQPLYTYYSDELPEVWAYFERHFQIPQDFRLDDASWITVSRRGRDRGPTAIDLHQRRAGARSWVRDLNGRPIEQDSSPHGRLAGDRRKIKGDSMA